ncbi:hypothetical protein, partial [Streptomyces acidicola]|uniref:hypothetical protein n=1 Tax=Streptomyces acidicola TaxID=2596892 RepID=UPI00381A1586
GGGGLAMSLAKDGGRDHDEDEGFKEDHGKEEREEHGKEREEHGKEHFGKERPKGGIHAGGGGLAMSLAKDGGRDHDEDEGFKEDHGKEEREEHGKEREEHGKEHFGKERPKGGIHAGGGGLATSGGSMTAGSVLLLGGLGAGAYMLRRRNAADAAA